MNLRETKKKLEKELSVVNMKNFNNFYGPALEVIDTYKNNGGLGKPLYDFLEELYKKHVGDEAKEEVIGELLTCIWHHCTPSKFISFPDFDPTTKTWKKNVS